jgi:hypothetical protein
VNEHLGSLGWACGGLLCLNTGACGVFSAPKPLVGGLDGVGDLGVELGERKGCLDYNLDVYIVHHYLNNVPSKYNCHDHSIRSNIPPPLERNENEPN